MLQEKAKWQHERTLTLEPRRGRILDKKGRILAVSIPLKSLFAKPALIKSPSKIARKISHIINIPYHKLLAKLKTKKNFVWIKRKLTPDQSKKIKQFNFKGIDIGNVTYSLW